MKLYSDAGGQAPSPRRVRMFLAEKFLSIEIVEMELHKENRSAGFRRKNPMSTLPVLELEDGTCISESVAICRYIEALYPDPPLFGSSPLEIGTVEMWNRRAEFAFYMPIEFAGGFLGAKAAADAKRRVEKTMWMFDDRLAISPFLAGERISVADITAKVALDFGVRFNDIGIPEQVSHFRRWNQDMESRVSTSA